MAQLNLTSFSAGTKAKSAEVNTNFSAIQTVVNALRPTLYVPFRGTLSVTTSFADEYQLKQALTLSAVALRVKTAPTGADLIIDILKNGTTIFSTKPRIVAGATTGGGGAVFSSTTIAADDVLTFNVDQVGSTVAGRDLTIALSFQL